MSSLAQVLATDDPPLESVALAIAADHDPRMDVPAEIAKLDRLAEALGRSASLEALVRHAYGTLELRVADDYDDPRASLLADVIATRRGTPVALAVVLIALGRRAGIGLQAIAFPGHFLVRAAEQDVFIDPADGRYPLPRAALIGLAQQALGSGPREAAERLEPVGARATAVRLLVNLLRAHRSRGDHARALVVCDRLFDTTGAAMHRCDRAAHALALGAARSAIDDFEAYLAAHPNAADADLVRRILARARQFASSPSN